MIGNIYVIGDEAQLNMLVALRNQYLYNYRLNLASQMGFNFEPHKLKIVMLSDVMPGDNYIVGSILLPKTNAMFYLADGDYNSFVNQYHFDLDNDAEAQEYIAVLLTGILERNFDFCFYYNNSDPEMWTPMAMALDAYFQSRYGVTLYDYNQVNFNNQLFLTPSVNPNYITKVTSIVDSYNLSNKNKGELFIEY